MSNQGLKEYLISQLSFFDDRLQDLLNAYFPLPSQTRDRNNMEYTLNCYTQKIEQLVQKINNKQPILPPYVLIGSRVTIQYMEDQESDSYTICFPDEVDPDRGNISFLSPIGHQLLMSALNETLTVFSPNGEYTILIQDIHFTGRETL